LESKVVIGLGNPGPKYENTRHNIGFKVLDSFLDLFLKEQECFRTINRVHAEVCEIFLKGEKLFFVKPLTFMNDSGKAVLALKRRGILGSEDNFLVVHDDLDIPLGRLKFARDASSGGHKGVESIIRALGHKNFDRLRIGIGRPNSKNEVVRYVLEPFSNDEKKIIEDILKISAEAIFCYLTQGLQRAMNKYHKIKIE